MLIKKILMLLMVLSVQHLRAQNHRETLADYLLPAFTNEALLFKTDSVYADVGLKTIGQARWNRGDYASLDTKIYRSYFNENHQLIYVERYGSIYEIHFTINENQEATIQKMITFQTDSMAMEANIVQEFKHEKPFLVLPTQDSTVEFRFYHPFDKKNYTCQATLTQEYIRGEMHKILKVQYDSEGITFEKVYAKGMGLMKEMRPFEKKYSLRENPVDYPIFEKWITAPTTKLWDSIWVRMNDIRAIQEDISKTYETRRNLTDNKKTELLTLMEYYQHKLPDAKNVLKYVAFMIYYEGLEAASIEKQSDNNDPMGYIYCRVDISSNSSKALFVRPSVDALPFKEIEPFIKDLKDQWNTNWDYLLAKKCGLYTIHIEEFAPSSKAMTPKYAKEILRTGQQFDREHKSSIPYLLDEAYNNTSKAADYLGNIPLKKLYRLKAFEALSLLTPTEAREDEAYIGYNLRQLNELLSSPADAEFAYRTSVAAGKIEFTADAQLFADRAFDWGFKNKDFLLYYSDLAFSNKDKTKLEKIVAGLESQIPTMTKPELEKMIAFYTFLGNKKAIKKCRVGL